MSNSRNKVFFNGIGYEVVDKKRDISGHKAMIEQQVYLIKCELNRLAGGKHGDLSNAHLVRSYADQMKYLEEILAAYERDQKAAT
jgi:hypothetical protein